MTIIALILNSCVSEKNDIKNQAFEVRDFNPLSNWDKINDEFKQKDAKYSLFLDYSLAIDSGFSIPSKNQLSNGEFEIQFTLKNETEQPGKYWYKIYYQNESYKFPEKDPNSDLLQHEFAHENFYGSWKRTNTGFKATNEIGSGKELLINDNFRIVGNPRNEEQFFYKGENDRWKRNPRVGNYSFLLVVVSDSAYQKGIIPNYLSDISIQKDSMFINPYYYFLYGDGSKNKEIEVKQSGDLLKLIANPNLGKGTFISKSRFHGKIDSSMFRCNCNNYDKMYFEAPFEQFVHYVDASTKFNNIPVIADVLNNEYSKMDYSYNKSFYRNEELIGTIPKTEPYPCQSVFSDSVDNKIVLKNIKSTFGNWQKQNVGVISRHGFTFGKYTVKAKLTELLNKDNMWNGLLNAIWLINQGGRGGSWNLRRSCTDVGYMATYWGGRDDKRAERITYSEIDFEILKTVPYCPDYIFPPVYNEAKTNKSNIYDWYVPFPEDVMAYDDKIVVACTNWDMACPQPENFNSGCNPIVYDDTTFESHRWEKVYRALCQKSLQNDDKLFGSDYYYFQIEWKPTEIIWRIGKEKDKMQVVGYMNESVTTIPNNQMLMIITQEFHTTKWWIGSQYDQGYIPFPKNDIIGEIYEFTVE